MARWLDNEMTTALTVMEVEWVVADTHGNMKMGRMDPVTTHTYLSSS
jgi:hypothetical protein